MNRIIGGLLVVSLLSRPSLIARDLAAYEIFHNQNKIVYVVKAEEDDKRKSKKSKDISALMETIADNARLLNGMLRAKQNLYAKIETKLDALRYAKKNLSEFQMAEFMAFAEASKEKSAELSNALWQIAEHKNLGSVQKELLHTNPDLDHIYDELALLDSYQRKALATLNDMAVTGGALLEAL